MKNIVVLSGAGISAESGINTFRDAGGLWEGHEVMSVASPQGWQNDQRLVLDFYNQRRSQLLKVSPNLGHKSLVDLETYYNVYVVTQNVDDLHERAGSKSVIHLHGELLKSQSTLDPELVYECRDDMNIGDTCEKGSQLRPFIVWFGEQVPKLENAVALIQQADIVIIVGTSMQVYPAASLAGYAPLHCQFFYLDPKPAVNEAVNNLSRLKVIKETATIGLPKLVNELISKQYLS
jgi:NAD-dependent protein deacetylase/lipoamidase